MISHRFNQKYKKLTSLLESCEEKNWVTGWFQNWALPELVTLKFLHLRGTWLLMEPWSYRENVSLSPKYPHSASRMDKIELILGSQTLQDVKHK